MGIQKENRSKSFSKKNLFRTIMAMLLMISLNMSLSNTVSAAATDASEAADSTRADQPAEEKQLKYGIMTANAKSGYTFYEFNDQTEDTASLEVTDNKHVMVPVQALADVMPGMNYTYIKAKKTLTLKNANNGKKIVYTIGKSYVNYYASAKAKAVKKKIADTVYVSERSGALMVPADSLKYIMATRGYQYYSPSLMQEKGYDTYTYSGLYVYNSMKAITELPLATKVYGISSTVKLTIPEGYSVSQIFDLLVKKGICTSTAGLYDAMDNYDYTVNYPLIKELEVNPNRCFRLEGYLYPDTYEFKLLSKPEDAIGKFLRNSKVKITEADKQRAAELGYSINEILTIASIIEKEAGNKSMMPDISSVLHNRLNIKMKLQVDCSVYYVERYIKPYISGDINRYNSYYNTRKCAALPAGPICNPGRAAINAALYPSTTDYLYFYSDKDGYHFNKEYVIPPKEEADSSEVTTSGE